MRVQNGGDIMKTIAERIMMVVDALGISKSDFARQLSLTPAYISKLGKNTDAVPSDRTISDICREFRVSEVWLRTGEGEMFLRQTEAEQLAEITTRMELDQDDTFISMITSAVKSYYKLSETEKSAISKLVDGMIEDLQAQKNTPDD